MIGVDHPEADDVRGAGDPAEDRVEDERQAERDHDPDQDGRTVPQPGLEVLQADQPGGSHRLPSRQSRGPAGQVQEDRLEVRFGDLHGSDGHAGRRHVGQDGGKLAPRVLHHQVDAAVERLGLADPRSRGQGVRGLGQVACRGQPHLVPFADHAHELGPGALGDQLAVVDDPDPVAEALGLLHVVRGVQHRHPGSGQPRRRSPGSRSGSAGRPRPSARPGSAASAGAAARCRCSGAASSRRNTAWSDRRPGRPGRSARAPRRSGASPARSACRRAGRRTSGSPGPTGPGRSPGPAARNRARSWPGPSGSSSARRPPGPRPRRVRAIRRSSRWTWSCPPRSARGARRSRRGRCANPTPSTATSLPKHRRNPRHSSTR